jgi:hypothetical protein
MKNLKETVYLYPLQSVEPKDGVEQIMSGYFASVKATTEALSLILKDDNYDVQIHSVNYYNHVSGENKGTLLLGIPESIALTRDETDKLLQLPGKHVFIGAGKIAQKNENNFGSLACAETVLNNSYNSGQAYFAFIADMNASSDLVESLASKKPGHLIYTWPEMSEEKSTYYSNMQSTCKFMPLPGRPVKADYPLFQKTYESFYKEHTDLIDSKRPLVVVHIPGNAGGILYSAEQAQAYTENLISRHSEKNPVYIAIQGNRTDKAVLDAMQDSFTSNRLQAYEQHSKKDFDFAIFDKKSSVYKASFLISEMTDRDVTIEIDVNSSAITSELNFAVSSDILLVSTPGVLQYQKASDIMNFYSANGLDVIQQKPLDSHQYVFELKKVSFKENGRDNLNGAKIVEKFSKQIAAHIS